MSTDFDDPVQKRASEFQAWFDGFTTVVRTLQGKGKLPVSTFNTGNFSFPEKAAETVNSFYWQLMNDLVRPMVKAANGNPETNIDRHKICSLIELTVVTLQPIECDDAVFARELNARLAYHCALSFISNWLKVGKDQVLKYVSSKVAENHLAWLQNYDSDEVAPPIFSNATTWQLIEENYLLRQEIAKRPAAPK